MLASTRRTGSPCALPVGTEAGAATLGSSTEGPQEVKQSCPTAQQSHSWVFTPQNTEALI